MRLASALRIGRRGVMALEFGLLMPVMILLLLASADLVATVRANLRIEMAAEQLAHITSQCQTITTPGDSQMLFAHGQRLVGNVGAVTGTTAGGAIIITAVYQVGGVNLIAWQLRDGSGSFVSSVGSGVRDSAATIAADYVVDPKHTLIVVEIFFNRNSWILSSGFMRDVGLTTVQAPKLLLSRAHNSAAVANVPANTVALGCFAT